MASINDGLGGTAGYGEGTFSSATKVAGGNDDGSVAVDISSVFGEAGLAFFDSSYTTLYINSNGLITFESANTGYSGNSLSDLSQPAIAPFWADHNIDAGGEIYWDVDPDAGTVTVTWHEVEPYSGDGDNTYQVVLTDTGDGDVKIEFIYDQIKWGESGNVAAIAGITDGNGNNFPLEGSGDETEVKKFDSTKFGDDDDTEKGRHTFELEDGIPNTKDGTVDGSGGDDTFSMSVLGHDIDVDGDAVTLGADSILTGAGDDFVDAADGSDTVHGGSGKDTILGGEGDDEIHGDGLSGAVEPVTTTINTSNFSDTSSGFTVSARNISNGSLSDASTDNVATYAGGFGASGSVSDSDSGVTQQTGFDLDSGLSEELIVDFDTPTDTATFSFMALFSSSYGEQAQWSIYNDGTLVAQSSFTEEVSGSTTGTIELSGYGAFDQIVFTGLPQTDGSDGSDFLITQITFETAVDSSVYSDSLVGGDGLDSILGGLGDDTVSGDGGDDTILGEDGDDNIAGGTGNDSVLGGIGSDSISGGEGDDYIEGGEGHDFLKSGSGQDTLEGGEGNDTLMNAAGDDSLVGGVGDDLIVATQGNDTLEGDAGSDTLMGGVENDSLDGGADNDLLLGDLAGVELNATGTDGVGLASGISDFPTTQITYELTFASTDTSGDTSLGSYAISGEDNEFSLQLQAGDLAIYVGGSFTNTGIPAATFLDGNINTLAVTWDSATGGLEVFVNGTSTYTGTTATGDTLGTGGTFALGQDQDVLGGGFDTTQAFEGTVFGVRIYDDVRTPSEIADTVQAPVADTSDANLIANWVADPNAATFTDQTGSHTMVMSGDVSATWSEGTDTLIGGDGDDTIYGGGGDDVIDGGAGSDSIDGGDGNDDITLGDPGGVTPTGTLVNDGDNINATTGSDSYIWNTDGSSSTAITLGGGVATGGSSDGDGQVDTVFVADTDDGGQLMLLQFDAGLDQILLPETPTTITNTAAVAGRSNFDVTYANGNTQSFVLFHNGGTTTDDSLFFDVAGPGSIGSTADGGEGNDTITGGAGDDTVDGGSGDDAIYGGGGADSLSGGAGDDTFLVTDGFGTDTVEGGDDTDQIDLSGLTGPVSVAHGNTSSGTLTDGADTLSFTGIEELTLTNHADYFESTSTAGNLGGDVSGGAGDDTLIGARGDHTLRGGDGDDQIHAGNGGSTLEGGDGNDTFFANFYSLSSKTNTYSGGSDFDVVFIEGTNVDGFSYNIDLTAGSDTYNNVYSGIEGIYGGSGNDTLSGSTADNLLSGGIGDDSISGGSGNDTLTGGDGDDYIDGGDGADTLISGDGQSSLIGGVGNDSLVGNATGTSDVTILVGGAGADTLDGSAGIYDVAQYYDSGAVNIDLTDGLTETGGEAAGDTLIGIEQVDGSNTGNDTIIADNSGMYLKGWGGNDSLIGGTGVDTIEGGAGDDLIQGGDGNDVLMTGLGNDTVFGGQGNDTIMNSDGDDSLDGGAGDDSIVATGGEDTLRGGTGADTMEGGDDADTFIIEDGFGNDSITGGEGTTDPGDTDYDTIDLSALSGPVTVTYDSTGAESGTITDGTDTITFSEIERIILTDQADFVDASDSHTGLGGDAPGIDVEGRGGDDTILGGRGGDTIDGGDDNDSIIGAHGDDSLTGGAGNDTIYGDDTDGGGNDTIDGGDGDDWLDGGVQADTIYGGAGDDTIRGGDGNDDLQGGDGADSFVMEDDFDDDTILGGEGGTDDDVIDLSGLPGAVTVTYTGAEAGTITDGNDTITFSEIERVITTDHADIVDASGQSGTTGIDVDTRGGDDTVTGGNNADTIEAGAGADQVTGGSGADSIDGGADDDTITGDGGEDTIDGGDGNDQLDGGGSADSLSGGSGDDTIQGGAGADTIEGGTGNDTLTGEGGDDIFTYTIGDGDDTITDFNFGNTGALGDGDTTNNDFIDLGSFYDSMGELREDFADDGVLNQSNSTVHGGDVDYSNNDEFGNDDSLTFQGASQSSFTADNTGVVCFTEGALITTASGIVPIECLSAGDMVLTRDNGFKPILWIGKRALGPADLAKAPHLQPIHIAPGLIGATQPLIVSPQHGVLIRQDGEETLVRAKHLAMMQGGQARVMTGRRNVCYYHLLLEDHQIIFANGAASESFYPGPEAIKALHTPARSEVFELFPDLASYTAPRAYGPHARMISKRRTLPENLRDLHAVSP